MTADEIIRSTYARLIDMRKNISEGGLIFSDLLDHYDLVLDDLEAVGHNLSRFRISQSAIQVSSKERWCRPPYFRTQVEGLLNLYSVSEEKIEFGFHPSK